MANGRLPFESNDRYNRCIIIQIINTIIALWFVDTANELERELSTHCDAVLTEENSLRHKIQSFVDHSSATITGLKEKYDQLRIDNELLDKLHTNHDTSGVAVSECRIETSSATGKQTETIGMYSADL